MIHQLRAQAISHSLFAPTTLQAAIDRMGFVQIDPIRSPAPAQDLILRHRVEGYRAGDLERCYPTLDVEEGFLYAYGFLPTAVWHTRQRAWEPASLSEMEQKALATIRSTGPSRPKDLEAILGAERSISGWGRVAKTTTVALNRLCWRGLIHVVQRENGVRTYEAAPALDERISPNERLRKLILVEANVLAPVDLKRLQSLTSALRRISFPEAADHRKLIREMLHSGELEQRTVDGTAYIWPASFLPAEEAPRVVRFLAPFDPVVWDRYRFEHFWGWAYRFEAYTPQAERIRGHYAMPLLWGDQIIGWANAGVLKEKLNIEVGFVDKRPAGREFQRELEAEVARLQTFLGLDFAF
ncbi:MAG TPA: crosslink repair DNA glycosylase YcaQ family protein [Capsulimonadaceae bacterium]|nr:crosslink repair DNA glycosylase YcaQ family protein [Capsulimonadaceae bacterium]